MPTRIAACFDRLKANNEPALIAYVTAGDPTPEATIEIVAALERGGTDIIELGVPFSDPVADGPVIMRASERALAAGTTLEKVLHIAAEIRKVSEIPIVLFSYLNPVIRYGFERLAKRAVECGVDGFLLTDLSVEEAAGFVDEAKAAGLDTIFLVAPTSTDRRLDLVAKYCSGFVYVVSRTGVTGEQSQVSAAVKPLVERLRQFTDLPLGVGFGISTAAQAGEVGAVADGVVVGSVLVRAIEATPVAALSDTMERMARELKEGAKTGRLS
ncbi:tryptophan synthase subunit alpha [Bryobacter aggregatus]|uniref:tryptophan synthase subunit alpha n=1 Tax=Bryobacter aggregatus TaxID=360054 RepID=UPI0004E0C082|nr:tryptophan synthase subunit alpha [Bryobacter aggregatus]